MLILLRLR